ncbi:MAG: hypothetical protein LUG13_08755 [Oscillospiraceae bacterium]|nr:hypothetical protein [Oscillospiraceae bacterium]
MQVYICIDDTDDISKHTSTGAIAQKVAQALQRRGAVLEEGITRHQLLLHPDIPYTSHNSAMCMALEFQDSPSLPALYDLVAPVILAAYAPGASPGLAIYRPGTRQNIQRLIRFGYRAKREVLSKADAYAAAADCKTVLLRELGGSGLGVIGALAGIGLRISRCDGTFRGKYGQDLAGRTVTADIVCRALHLHQILDGNGQALPASAEVIIEDYTKIALIAGKRCSIVSHVQGGTPVLSSICMRESPPVCPWYQEDNDEEEMCSGDGKVCANCLFRRWTATGYDCVRGAGG